MRAISAWAASSAPAARSMSLRSELRDQPVVVPQVGAHHPVGKPCMVLEPPGQVLQKCHRSFRASRFDVLDELTGALEQVVMLLLVPLEIGALSRLHDPLLVRKVLLNGREQRPGQ